MLSRLTSSKGSPIDDDDDDEAAHIQVLQKTKTITKEVNTKINTSFVLIGVCLKIFHDWVSNNGI